MTRNYHRTINSGINKYRDQDINMISNRNIIVN
jgi:hypothetical protein